MRLENPQEYLALTLGILLLKGMLKNEIGDYKNPSYFIFNIPLFVSLHHIYTVRNGVYTQCCVSRIICSFTPSGLVRKKHSIFFPII